VAELVPAFVDRENAAEEDEQRNDEREEVDLASVAERMPLVGGSRCPPDADQEQDLVDRINQRMNALGEHRGATADEAATELGDRDRQVRASGSPLVAGFFQRSDSAKTCRNGRLFRYHMNWPRIRSHCGSERKKASLRHVC
jgi:hypothetical protein